MVKTEKECGTLRKKYEFNHNITNNIMSLTLLHHYV